MSAPLEALAAMLEEAEEERYAAIVFGDWEGSREPALRKRRLMADYWRATNPPPTLRQVTMSAIGETYDKA